MAAALKSLSLWIVSIVALISMALAQDEKPFLFHGFNNSNLNMEQGAKILPNGLLRLTNSSELVTGIAFYPLPFKFNTSSSQSLSFSTNLVFAMVPTPSNFSGNGMTFFLSPSMDLNEAVTGSYLGLFNITTNGKPENHILAVELDTVLSPEFEDIDGNHVGIDVNSLISNDSASAGYFSDKDGKNISLFLASGDPIQMWIDYSGAEMLLNVTLAPLKISKPSRPLLSTRIDLSQILLDSMYVGLSAATGTRVNDHYVLGWSFSRNGQAQNLDISKLPPVPPRPRPSAGTSGSQSQRKVMMAVVLAAVAAVLITVGGSIFIVRKKKYEEVCEDWEKEFGPHRISYKSLYRATKGFKDRELIGQGGFGKVYRGVFHSSNVQIAVKKISHDSNQGMKQFVAEIVTMRRLRHRNLVQLRGYCRRKGELFLVYDYMPNGSLDKILYSNRIPNLNWFQRFRILRGVASGLLYLHEEWEQVVLHRDIKSANVLLDADFNGKLGDFGLARLYERDTNPQTTNVVGTLGYMAPELLRTGRATTSTDVFAFGAFMLEVACGRRPLEQDGYAGDLNLVDFVVDCWKKGAILDASDPRLEGLYVGEQMELVLKLGLFCSHPNPAARPTIRQVMQYLDGDAKFPDISADSSVVDVFTTSNEASKIEMSFSSLFESSSSHTLSTIDSIITMGR